MGSRLNMASSRYPVLAGADFPTTGPVMGTRRTVARWLRSTWAARAASRPWPVMGTRRTVARWLRATWAAQQGREMAIFRTLLTQPGTRCCIAILEIYAPIFRTRWQPMVLRQRGRVWQSGSRTWTCGVGRPFVVRTRTGPAGSTLIIGYHCPVGNGLSAGQPECRSRTFAAPSPYSFQIDDGKLPGPALLLLARLL